MKTFYQISGIDLEDYYIPTSIFTYGGLWTWGYNFSGALGDGTTIAYRSSPAQTTAAGITWKTAAAGGGYTGAVIKTDGTLWTWGYNTYGGLGTNDTVDRSSPVQTVSGGTNWKQAACGNSHSTAVKADGTLWIWGRNDNGQLGDGTLVGKSSPIQTVAGSSFWMQVSAGGFHTAAIKTDGTLWTWGYNLYGQLGDNTISNRSSPVQTVTLGTNWKQISCGYYVSSAIKTDGTLWTWGFNTYGGLGNGDTVHKSSPVQTISGGTNWKQIAAGNFQMAAIKTDGTLWGWGRNRFGGLGDGTSVNKSSPVQTISGGTNWRQASSGSEYTSAIKTDGTLWSWGDNSLGQLGAATSTLYYSSPVQTVAAGTNWKLVACMQYTNVAIQDNTPY